MTPTLVSSVAYRGDRLLVTWFHTDAENTFGSFVMVRPGGEDVTVYINAHAANLVVSLIAAELAYAKSQILYGRATDGTLQNGRFAIFPPLRWATLNDALAEIRAFYAVAIQEEAIFLGDYLSSLSDAVLRNLFNMTQAEVNSLRTNKLTPARTLANNLRASSGA